MVIGVSTFYSVNSKSVLDSVKQLHNAGIKAMELLYESRLEKPISKTDMVELNKVKKEYCLDYSMHGPYLNITYAHPNKRYRDFFKKCVEESLDCAVRIGCTHYVMHGGLLPTGVMKVESGLNRQQVMQIFIDSYSELFRKYSANLQILIENLGDRQIGGKVEDILQIKNSLPFVGFCFDIAHAINTRTYTDLINKLKIDYIHITDNDTIADQHLALGKGKINFRKIFNDIKEKGYNGKIIIECAGFDDCINSFEYLNKYLKIY